MTDSQQPNISKPISFDVIIAGGAMAGGNISARVAAPQPR